MDTAKESLKLLRHYSTRRRYAASTRQSLNSLTKQIVDFPFELIVIDNASSDNTFEIASHFTRKVYQNKERGKISCLKYGLSYAEGDIIAFADADTIYPTNWVSSIIRLFSESDKYQLVFGSTDLGFQSLRYKKVASFISSCFIVPSLWFGVTCSVGFNMTVRKPALNNIFSHLDSVALSGWAIGTLAYRLYGRDCIRYSQNLQVPKCMRRYNRKGFWKSCSVWMGEWIRLAAGKNLKIMEREYYT